MSTPDIQGITEQDLANYLAANPSFFERYADLLAAIQLSHPLGHRTVSLQERQADMLRQRIKERRPYRELADGRFAAIPCDGPWDGLAPATGVQAGRRSAQGKGTIGA